ncbi:hypothetical protein LLE49_13715 [Alicyclobacillus tolerans]|nr:hypothetical protein [Alicyclobacillus tolerans]MCF8565776.1 hypothetical protein [Alicyclobacillus tolerans]
MFRQHPLYLVAVLLLAAGLQWFLTRKLGRSLKRAETAQTANPNPDDDSK